MSEYFISKNETFYHCLSGLALMIFWIFRSTVATFYWDCSRFPEAMLTRIRAYYGITCVTGRTIDLCLFIWNKIFLLIDVMAVCVIRKQELRLTEIITTYRSSPSEVFLGKGFLKICSKFTGEHPCRSAISIKLQYNLQPHKYAAYLQNTFF